MKNDILKQNVAIRKSRISNRMFTINVFIFSSNCYRLLTQLI